MQYLVLNSNNLSFLNENLIFSESYIVLSSKDEILDYSRNLGFRTERVEVDVLIRFKSALIRHLLHLPLSKKNYYLMRFFRLRFSRIVLLRILFEWLANNILPKFDIEFLAKVLFQARDIENRVLVISEFTDVAVFSKYSFSEISYYLYSWDHITKFKIPSKNWKFFTWSNDTKDHVKSLVGTADIRAIGTSRFKELQSYCPSESLGERYDAYVLLSSGINKVIDNEIRFLELLQKSFPNYRIIIRKYPLAQYSKVQQDVLRNFILDDGMNKYQLMQISDKVIHFGSTIGLEARYIHDEVYMFSTESRELFWLNLFAKQHQNNYFFVDRKINHIVDIINGEIIFRRVQLGECSILNLKSDFDLYDSLAN